MFVYWGNLGYLPDNHIDIHEKQITHLRVKIRNIFLRENSYLPYNIFSANKNDNPPSRTSPLSRLIDSVCIVTCNFTFYIQLKFLNTLSNNKLRADSGKRKVGLFLKKSSGVIRIAIFRVVGINHAFYLKPWGYLVPGSYIIYSLKHAYKIQPNEPTKKVPNLLYQACKHLHFRRDHIPRVPVITFQILRDDWRKLLYAPVLAWPSWPQPLGFMSIQYSGR